jgi:hypothetical protein
MFHICQTSIVADYVHRFAQLMDQIAAYELHPDLVHYTTRFLDGLKPAVRVLVAIQQPPNLDTAYSLALLYEELGDGATSLPSGVSPSSSSRRFHQVAVPAAPPLPPTKWISHSVEEKRMNELARSPVEDKWSNLKAYRRSKGLCFVCGERWSREHQCKAAIQLHVIQEMVDYLQCSDSSEEGEPAGGVQQQPPVQPPPVQPAPQQQLMALSAAAMSSAVQAPHTIQLHVTIQGHDFFFLVDSGSSSCFIDSQKAGLLTGLAELPVQVAGGSVLQCVAHFPLLAWEADGALFHDTFKVLQLASYDGIIGMDWLSKYSPMVTHWEQGWLAIQYEGRQVVLQGDQQQFITHAMVELQLLQEADQLKQVLPSEIQDSGVVGQICSCVCCSKWIATSAL